MHQAQGGMGSFEGNGSSLQEGRTRRWARELPPNETLRALAEVQALEARSDPEVVAFREQILTNKFLKLEELENWLQQKFEQEGERHTILQIQLPLDLAPDPQSPDWHQIVKENLDKGCLLCRGFTELKYPKPHGQGTGLLHGIRKDKESDLGWLKRIAERLGQEYGWSEPDAVAFVLTDAIPVLPLARIEWMWSSRRPFYTQRITLQVLPWLSPSEVARLYREARRLTPFGEYLRPRKPKALTEKGRALAVFLASTPDLSWSKRMEEWNKKYPQWRYNYISTFRRDALAAYKKVTGGTPLTRNRRRIKSSD